MSRVSRIALAAMIAGVALTLHAQEAASTAPTATVAVDLVVNRAGEVTMYRSTGPDALRAAAVKAAWERKNSWDLAFAAGEQTTAVKVAVEFALGPGGQALPTVVAQTGKRLTLYAAVGPKVTQFEVDPVEGTLTERSSAPLPQNAQYAWRHPFLKVLYVAWAQSITAPPFGVTAFTIDAKSGALAPLGDPVPLRARPVHVSVNPKGTHLLFAYNNPPAGLSVHELAGDGRIGKEIPQPGVVDGGIYAHQVTVDPTNTMAILVTRGNVPAEAPSGVEEPGSLKVFKFKDGVLSNEVSVTRNGGFGFKPRHVDYFGDRFVFLAIERQNQIAVYDRTADGMLASAARFTKNTLADPVNNNETLRPAQMTGPIHIHPNWRYVYIGNRNNNTANGEFAGGENSVAVFSINQQTGEPTLIQNADSHGFVPRTMALDVSGRLLVVANQSAIAVRDSSGQLATVSANLAVFKIGTDGKLEYKRKYDVPSGGVLGTIQWVGFF